MSFMEQVKDLYARLKGRDQKARQEVLEGLPKALADAYHSFRRDRMYDLENAKGTSEHLSPSGKYKLLVTSFTSGPGTWNVTEGKVFRVDSDTPIASIRRNYSAFPYCFVEGHPKGDFLIGGEDYQGQTVIELDTGTKRNLLPEEAAIGNGFCWGGYSYNSETQLLLVDGCFWACPYEYRFYDFSDPMQKGWPQLELVPQDEENGEGYLETDSKEPSFEPDGTIVWYQTKYGSIGDEDYYEAEDDDGNKREQRITATRTFKREGLKLVETASWVSDDEKEYRTQQEEGQRRWQEWQDSYRATDPLYLRAKELSQDKPFTVPQYFSTGVTYDKWCPDFKERETRICLQVFETKTRRVTVEIAAKTGPVKLVLVDREADKSRDQFFMEHSVESIDKAFAAARQYLEAVP